MPYQKMIWHFFVQIKINLYLASYKKLNKMNFKSIVALILLALFIMVSIQNVEVIPVHFLFWKMEISKLLLIILTLVIGIILGIIIPSLLKKSPPKESK
jgi:uncharacterized integral membrane protein